MASPLISGRPYKRRNGAQVFGLLLLTALYSASPLPVSRAVPQPAKSETGETSELAIENLLEPIRVKYHLPALGGAVIGPSGPIGVRAVGIRKFGDPTRVTSNDSFHLGSCSKAMTATLAGILVEERKLRWSTTLLQAFPELASKMNAEYQKVTLEQLLSHHGGFPSRNNPLSLPWSKIYSLKGSPREQRYEYVRRFLEEAPEAKPGTKFIYSNPGYAAAAAMMEQITNTSWETLIRRRLFEPLKMRSAGFGPMGTAGKVDEPWQHRLADPDSLDGKTKHEPIDPTPRNDNPDAIAPAGKVHCSLADWARFIQLHLAGEAGKSKLLKPETIRYLHRPYADNYALGWLATDRDWGGGRVLTHSGSNTQNFCVVWMAPKRQFAVLICTNQGGKAADAACDEAAASLIQHFLLGAPK